MSGQKDDLLDKQFEGLSADAIADLATFKAPLKAVLPPTTGSLIVRDANDRVLVEIPLVEPEEEAFMAWAVGMWNRLASGGKQAQRCGDCGGTPDQSPTIICANHPLPGEHQERST